MWIATPSSYRTCTDYSLPVSRRAAKHSVRHHPSFSARDQRRRRCMWGFVAVVNAHLEQLRQSSGSTSVLSETATLAGLQRS